MLPWWHLATSLIISFFLASVFELDFSTGLRWIVVGCMVGTFIDLDHFLYARLTFGKEWLKYTKSCIEDPKGLMRKFQEKGSLSSHAFRRLTLHAITMPLVFLVSLYAFPSYSLVIGAVLLVHLVLDVEPRWLLV
jgi:hypothetical protein